MLKLWIFACVLYSAHKKSLLMFRIWPYKGHHGKMWEKKSLLNNHNNIYKEDTKAKIYKDKQYMILDDNKMTAITGLWKYLTFKIKIYLRGS